MSKKKRKNPEKSPTAIESISQKQRENPSHQYSKKKKEKNLIIAHISPRSSERERKT